MPASNGKITAPVGLASVAQVLGEPVTDTGTLCRSSKVNPHSLIKPTFINATHPQEGMYDPAWLSNAQNYTLALLVPAAHLPSVQNSFDISTKGAAEYPCVAEYAFSSGAWVQHSLHAWGYVVPYVQRAQDIFALTSLVWKHFTPEDGDTASLNAWAWDDHFDGYIHGAEPVNPMTAVQIEYGKPIAYTPNVSTGPYTASDVLGPNPTGHPGGVVSVPAVLGTDSTFRYGMTVFWREDDDDKFTEVRSFLGGPASGSVSGLNGKPILGAVGIDSDSVMAVDGEYVIVPWVAKGVTGVSSSGKLQVSSSGARFYSFRFSSLFSGHVRRTVESHHIGIIAMSFQGSDAKLVKLSFVSHQASGQDRWKCEFTIYNKWKDYPMTAHRFFLQVEYRDNTGTVRNVGMRDNDGLKTYGATGTNLAYTVLNVADISFSSGELTVNQKGVKLTNPYGGAGFGTSKVTILFNVPSDAQTDPEFRRLGFTSLDNNASKPISVDVKLLGSGLLADMSSSFENLGDLLMKP